MDWIEKNNSLVGKFVFKDFVEAFGFMTQVAICAEKANHHPTWTNVYNTVDIILTTHDAGNTITEKDRSLSEVISKMFQKYGKA